MSAVSDTAHTPHGEFTWITSRTEWNECPRERGGRRKRATGRKGGMDLVDQSASVLSSACRSRYMRSITSSAACDPLPFAPYESSITQPYSATSRSFAITDQRAGEHAGTHMWLCETLNAYGVTLTLANDSRHSPGTAYTQ